MIIVTLCGKKVWHTTTSEYDVECRKGWLVTINTEVWFFKSNANEWI